MANTPYDMLPQTKESIFHILKHYEQFKQDRKTRGLTQHQPMMVGVSGCQGSGKTTLCNTLTHLLQKKPHHLRVINFSLDDLYLTHTDQIALSKKHPHNPLYQQRGQAGSHDLSLLSKTLDKILTAKSGQEIPIPIYDKSLHNGMGDRLERPDWQVQTAPVDIVLFEGWMLGFKPLEEKQFKDMHVEPEYTHTMNELLKPYEKDIYPFFDIFIHLSPADLQQVYNWRLQQEHHMKETRGVQGLSDEAVKAFVETYMPAYQLYLPRLNEVGFFGKGTHGEQLKSYEGLNRADGGYSRPQRHLKIVLDQDRRVTETECISEEPTTTATVQQSESSGNSILITKPFIYRCAVIGVLGIIGFKRKSILDSFFKFTNKFATH